MQGESPCSRQGSVFLLVCFRFGGMHERVTVSGNVAHTLQGWQRGAGEVGRGRDWAWGRLGVMTGREGGACE